MQATVWEAGTLLLGMTRSFTSGTEVGEVVGSADWMHRLSLQVPLKPGRLSFGHPDLHLG